MTKSFIILLMFLLFIIPSSAQVLLTETFSYEDGALVDTIGLDPTSPYYPVTNVNVSGGNWTRTGASFYPGPLMVQGAPLTYTGYVLSGIGKKVLEPNILVASQSAYRSFTPSTAVYYSLLLRADSIAELAGASKGQAVFTHGITSSTYRGLLLFYKASTPDKYVLGVSNTRDVNQAYATSKELDSAVTYLVVVYTDRATGTSKLWINPDLSSPEPTPDAVSTFNAEPGTFLTNVTLYQRTNGSPPCWFGGLRVAKTWSDLSFSGPLPSISGESFDMDTIHVGAWKKQSIVVASYGSDSLKIDSVKSNSSIFTVLPSGSLGIPPGGQQTFVVTAKLDSALDRTGVLTFYHNGSPATNDASCTVHPLPVDLFTETFGYSAGALHSGTELSPTANVSDGRWFNNSSSALTDTIVVHAGALTFSGYNLSGIGNKIYCKNSANGFDRAIRSFSNTVDQYSNQMSYSFMMKMADVSTLSSYPSSYGEIISGIGPVTIPSDQTNRFAKQALRGMLRVRSGSVPGTWQVGVNTSSVKSGPMGWYDVDLDSSLTYLFVVRYVIGDSISLWVNPDMSGVEPLPTVKVDINDAVPTIADFGHFTVQQNGDKPKCYIGGIRVAESMFTAISVDMSLSAGWNIVSVPLQVTDYRKNVLFADAISNAYAFNGSYVSEDTLVPGVGYWLKYSASTILPFTASPHQNLSVAVKTGWNLIGAPSVKTIALSISSEPAGIVTGSFFGFENGYQISDTLYPGKGYWVKVTGDGILRFEGTLANRIKIVKTEEMPPNPPSLEFGNSGKIPAGFEVCQNYPNPFNPVTTIKYGMPQSGHVTLTVFNSLGQQIAELINTVQEAGYHEAEFDGSTFSSGVYYYRLQYGQYTETRKLLLMK